MRLIFGDGWLGNILAKSYGCHISPGEINEVVDIDDTYDTVINCAAKTTIDWCESNKVETIKSNVSGAVNLAKVCKELGKKYVFISSACIFESEHPHDVKYEDDTPNPKCFYARSKALAEELILEANPDTLIIRIRLPLSEIPHPRNTITKLLSYTNLNDNEESVTVIEDMIPVLDELIRKKATGIYHLVNAGTVSPEYIGTMFNHKFEIWSKQAQDIELKEKGKAKRVTTIVGSKRIPLLPEIRNRLLSIKEKYEDSHNRK